MIPFLVVGRLTVAVRACHDGFRFVAVDGMGERYESSLYAEHDVCARAGKACFPDAEPVTDADRCRPAPLAKCWAPSP